MERETDSPDWETSFQSAARIVSITRIILLIIKRKYTYSNKEAKQEYLRYSEAFVSVGISRPGSTQPAAAGYNVRLTRPAPSEPTSDAAH
jgi:hypothetical protein